MVPKIPKEEIERTIAIIDEQMTRNLAMAAAESRKRLWEEIRKSLLAMGADREELIAARASVATYPKQMEQFAAWLAENPTATHKDRFLAVNKFVGIPTDGSRQEEEPLPEEPDW